MEGTRLQALLALRKSCAELKTHAQAPLTAQLDIIMIVLASLIAAERDLPALQRGLLARYEQELSAPGTSLASPEGSGDDAARRLEHVLRHIQDALRAQRCLSDTPGASTLDLKTIAQRERDFATGLQQAIAAEIRRGESLASPGETPGTEFDRTAFQDYLVGSLGEDRAVQVREVALASRGFSKKTLLVRLANTRALPAEVAVRVDRQFNFLGTTVVEEFAPLAALHRAAIRLPKPLALEPSGTVLDGPFIIFEKCAGSLVGNHFQPPAHNLRLAEDVARCLVQIHRVPVEDLPRLRGADVPTETQVRREIDKSHADWVALDRVVPLIEAAFSWLYSNLHLASGPPAVVHGDFNFNNLLIVGDRVSAIVDWEFLHVGHPAEDLGWMHYGAEGICGWDEFLDLYARAGGYAIDRRSLGFFILLGQTRLAVMTLQTESGFAAGRFDDLKFGLAGALFTNVALSRIGTLLEALA